MAHSSLVFALMMSFIGATIWQIQFFTLPKTGISFGVRFGCVAPVVWASSFAQNVRKNLQGSVALEGAEVGQQRPKQAPWRQ